MFALVAASRARGVVLQLLDLAGHGLELPLDVRQAADARVRVGEIVPRLRGGDDLDTGARGRVDLVALPVVPVEVRVDDLPHRGVRDRLHLPIDLHRGGGLRVGVDDDDAVVRDDHRRVRVHLVLRRRDGRVDPVGHLLELEQLLRVGVGMRRHRAAELVGVEGVDGRSRDADLGENLSTGPLLRHVALRRASGM